jgi:hypothetical protein
MAYPTSMSPPRTLGTVDEAKLLLVMPGANALTHGNSGRAKFLGFARLRPN